MATNPQTQALLEQALTHLLEEQAKILKSKHAPLLLAPAAALGALASETWTLLAQGFHKIQATDQLTAKARKCEQAIDLASVDNWFPMLISVSSIFERIEESFALRPIEEKLDLKAAIAVRNHFHNLRILLLEQLLSARMLINNNDYGAEVERVWQQFLQRELGPEFRVLLGGRMLDYKGNDAGVQIDLLIVPVDAHIIVPTTADGGKANVLCDQVVAAVMTTSNLTVKKFGEDWEKLDRVSKLFKFTDEFPNGKEQAWPLCYIAAGQSAPLKDLEKAWLSAAHEDSSKTFVPQFVVSLDSGFLYSGATSWPRPPYPGNYVNRDQVASESGIHSGLGLAWILTQVRARGKLMQGKPVRSVGRFVKLLQDATLKSATPPTWSQRFDTFGAGSHIAGLFGWGGSGRWVHNHLFVSSLRKYFPGSEQTHECFVSKGGVDITNMNWKERDKHLRWFNYRSSRICGGLLALEEWSEREAQLHMDKRIAVFDVETGEELHGDYLNDVQAEEMDQVLNDMNATRRRPTSSS